MLSWKWKKYNASTYILHHTWMVSPISIHLCGNSLCVWKHMGRAYWTQLCTLCFLYTSWMELYVCGFVFTCWCIVIITFLFPQDSNLQLYVYGYPYAYELPLCTWDKENCWYIHMHMGWPYIAMWVNYACLWYGTCSYITDSFATIVTSFRNSHSKIRNDKVVTIQLAI